MPPIFEFQCKVCDTLIERFCSSDVQTSYCNNCDGPYAEKIMSSPMGYVRGTETPVSYNRKR
jgi:hypothetical protein